LKENKKKYGIKNLSKNICQLKSLQVARVWRAKELETAKKRLKMEKDLREARARQAEEKKRQREAELEKEAKDVKILMARIDEDRYKLQEEKIKHEQVLRRKKCVCILNLFF